MNFVLMGEMFNPPSVGEAYRYVERARYRDVSYHPEYDDPHFVFSHMEVELRTFTVFKFTPKGFWINYNGEKKFVLNSGKKRFAWLSREDALTSFIARKEVHASYARKRLDRVEEALKIANKMLKEGKA